MLFESLGSQIEAADGLLAYNEEFLVIDLLVICHFIYFWFKTYRKTGWVIDYWHTTILMYFVIFTFIQYPFISSMANVLALGGFWIRVKDAAESVLFINIIGYMCIYFGRYFYDNIYGGKSILNLLDRVVYNNIKNRLIMHFYGIVCLVLAGGFILLQIKLGILGNPRAFFLEANTYRALFNGFTAILSVLTIYYIIRILDYNCRADKIIGFVLIFFTVFVGARGVFVGAITSMLFFCIYKKQGRIDLLKVSLSVFVIFIIFLGLTWFRGEIELEGASIYTVVIGMLFYGNNFSDLRDGALFFASNNDTILYGKTYIAGLMSFIPRFLSEFRECWAIGVVTASTVGYDPMMHPGLRISKFGEPYLNFSYMGVVLSGIIYGYFLRKYDLLLKRCMSDNVPIAKFYSISYFTMTIIEGLFSSAGFYGVYVFFVINVIIYMTGKIFTAFGLVNKQS